MALQGKHQPYQRLNCWRRGWDSNPRYGYPYNGFRDRPIRPLWHLSVRAHVACRLATATWKGPNRPETRDDRSSRCCCRQLTYRLRHLYCAAQGFLRLAARLWAPVFQPRIWTDNAHVRGHSHGRQAISRGAERHHRDREDRRQARRYRRARRGSSARRRWRPQDGQPDDCRRAGRCRGHRAEARRQDRRVQEEAAQELPPQERPSSVADGAPHHRDLDRRQEAVEGGTEARAEEGREGGAQGRRPKSETKPAEEGRSQTCREEARDQGRGKSSRQEAGGQAEEV